MSLASLNRKQLSSRLYPAQLASNGCYHNSDECDDVVYDILSTKVCRLLSKLTLFC